MKPHLKTTAKAVFLMILLFFNKTEWLLISIAVILLNIFLYPNYIIDVTILRRWIRSQFL
jgi:hypothetical protein